MKPILISLIVAMALGLVAQAGLGTKALIQQEWLDHTFWAVIGAGVLLAAIDAIRCIFCRRSGNPHVICNKTHC